MASATTSVVMALIVLVVVSSFVLPTAHADDGFISSTCKKTKNATICVALLSADPRSTHGTTEHDLASIALKIAIDTIYNNVKVIAGLFKKKKGMPEEGALYVCHGAYLDAHIELDLDARPSFDHRDYAHASKALSLAMGTRDACEKAFKGISKQSPMTDIDRQMTEHCGVAADIMGLLVTK